MKKLLFLTTILITNLAISQVPTNGLIGYWPFNGNANDESGNGNNGTLFNNPTYGNGKIDQAINLSGTDYVNIPVIPLTNNFFTITGWIKKTGTTWGCVFALGNTNDNNPILSICLKQSNIELVNRNNSLVGLVINFPYTLSSDWNFFAWTCTKNQSNLYINDVLIHTDNFTENTAIFNTCNIGIRKRIITDNPFIGAIDNMRIYNRILAINEMTQLYNENSPPPPSINEWQLNGNNIYYNGGNVGIGVDNPAAKLTVNGPILSTEVKVKIDISTYPDFVFKPEYRLQSLQEVERYINENGHLPEIPKAIDVKEGINLGEMNTMLLLKLEEITLYMIEQNKKIQALEEKIKTLRPASK